MSEPSIAGLIAELRKQRDDLRKMHPAYDIPLLTKAADALEKQATDLADRESKLEERLAFLQLEAEHADKFDVNPIVWPDELSALVAIARRALPAPSGEMREQMVTAVATAFRDRIGLARTQRQELAEIAVDALDALRPSASPQGDRNEQIKAMIARFDEKVKTWTPQQALDYLVELGTHDADGNLTPEYGGSSPQGDESALRTHEDALMHWLRVDACQLAAVDPREMTSWIAADKLFDLTQRVSRIAVPESIKTQGGE